MWYVSIAAASYFSKRLWRAAVVAMVSALGHGAAFIRPLSLLPHHGLWRWIAETYVIFVVVVRIPVRVRISEHIY